MDFMIFFSTAMCLLACYNVFLIAPLIFKVLAIIAAVIVIKIAFETIF